MAAAEGIGDHAVPWLIYRVVDSMWTANILLTCLTYGAVLVATTQGEKEWKII